MISFLESLAGTFFGGGALILVLALLFKHYKDELEGPSSGLSDDFTSPLGKWFVAANLIEDEKLKFRAIEGLAGARNLEQLKTIGAGINKVLSKQERGRA